MFATGHGWKGDKSIYTCAFYHDITSSHTHSPNKVMPTELDRFFNVYGNLLKSSMNTLRKRDKKREKLRADKATARKQRLAKDVVVEGSKRGNGRRKRQRKVKAAEKREEARKRMQEREDAKNKTKVF